MILRIGLWALWVAWLLILPFALAFTVFIASDSGPDLVFFGIPVFALGGFFYWAAQPVPRWVQGNVLALVGAGLAAAILSVTKLGAAELGGSVLAFGAIVLAVAVVGVLISGLIHRRLVATLKWFVGVLGLGAASLGAVYGLAMVALYAPMEPSDTHALGGDAAMAGDTPLVVMAHGHGAAHVYAGEKLVAMVRGHGARVVHAAFTTDRNGVMTIDASGGTRVTSVGAAWAQMHQWADMSSVMRMGHKRLWEPYVGAASDWALEQVAQVLPLHIPKHARGGRGAVFKDCPACPQMVVIKPGSFLMGSPWFEEGRQGDEGPRRLVTIAKPFAVGRFEVTFAQWDAAQDDPEWEKVTGVAPRKPEDEGWGRGNRPVINVSWEDATAYAKWLTKTTGHTYRLLSEAEWEYVARAGTTSRYSFGDDDAVLGDYGWYTSNSDSKTQPVGEKKPNDFGLYDIQGNVWEWTQDCWNENYEGSPSNGTALTTGDCGRRVLRGGSWSSDPQDLRSALRIRSSSVDRNFNFGFRVGRTLTP